MVGLVGVGLVVLTLVAGDFLDGVLDGVDLTGGILSTPVLGGFLAAFGLVGAVTVGALGPLVAALAGAGAGVGFGALALALTRRVMHMPTDPTPRTEDLVGRAGTVLSRVPEGGYGQVRVATHGQHIHVSARAAAPLAAGAAVVVVEVLSSSAVLVAPLELGLPSTELGKATPWQS